MLGDGSYEGRCPFLVHLSSLLFLGVGSARNQLSPHGPNMPCPLPILGSSRLLADFLSGSNLIWEKVWAGLFSPWVAVVVIAVYADQTILLLDGRSRCGQDVGKGQLAAPGRR